jgi:hypothetical protein
MDSYIIPEADVLMKMENEVRTRFGLRAKSDVDLHKKEYTEEIAKILSSLGYNKDFKVSKEARNNLENENFHCLNRAIQELGLGEGNF